jgi:GDP-L-fucose synthase
MKKKIILIGGFGFIGSNIFNKLKNNHLILRLSRRNGFDILNQKKIINKINSFKPNYIINCAVAHGGLSYINEKPANIFAENSKIHFALYEALSKSNFSKKTIIINLISNCAYFHELTTQNEKEWLAGEAHDSVLPFAVSKRISYYLSKFYLKQYSINSKNLILPNAFGPGDYTDPKRTHALNGIIIRFIKAVNSNEKIFSIWGTGKPKREWIYVDDISKLIEIEINKNYIKDIEPVNFGQNKSLSILHISKTVKSILKSKIKLVTDPAKMDGAMLKQLGNKKFKSLFGNYKFYNFDDGVKKTIKYYSREINDD